MIQDGAGSLARTVARNAAWVAGARVCAILVNLVTVPIFLMKLGAVNYGVYLLIQSLLGATGIFNLGFGEAAIKYMAESSAQDSKGLVGKYFRCALGMSAVVSLVVFGALVGAVGPVVDWLLRISPGQRHVAIISMLWFGCAWMLRNVNSTFSTIPAARQRYDIVTAIREGASLLERLLGVGIVMWGGGLVQIFQSQIFPQLIALATYFAVAKRFLPGVALRPSVDAEILRKFANFGVWQSVSSVLFELSQSLDRWFIAGLVSTRAVAYYGAVQVAATGIGGGLVSLGSVLVPTFSHIDRQREKARSGQVFMSSSWALSVVGSAICVPLVWFGRDFLMLWLGPEVAQEAHRTLLVVLAAQILTGALVVQNTYLVGVGRTGWNAWMAVANVLAVCAVNWICLSSFGMGGAGWSRVAAAVCGWCGLVLMRKRLLPLTAGRSYRWALFGPSLLGLVCMAAGYGFSLAGLMPKADTWPLLVTYVVVMAIAVGLANLSIDSLVGRGEGRWRQIAGSLGIPLRQVIG